ncbi:MAG: 30S ribosome-binding factor RbfA [Oscillospiraceae bacterium]|nr:30S ribosome-binding factor RbfA [Oscillospiraceae bacterium]
MPSYRTARAAEDVQRELSDIMRTLKDPRVSGLLSIVKLELAGDYSHCKVYVSSMEGLEQTTGAVEGLTSAAGFIRREIGARLKLRKTPQFHFIADNGIEQSAVLGQKMRDLGLLNKTEEDEPDGQPD